MKTSLEKKIGRFLDEIAQLEVDIVAIEEELLKTYEKQPDKYRHQIISLRDKLNPLRWD